MNPDISPTSYLALVGAPNCGKTSLFNVLTGSRQKVANYAGVTVERKEGFLKLPSGDQIKILDLPGTYSLKAHTLDEEVTRDVLLSKKYEAQPPCLIIAVADATNLERNLSLVLELKDLGIPTLLVLNMMDLARRRGFKLNLNQLEQELGIPVFPVVAVRREGIDALVQKIESMSSSFVEATKRQRLEFSAKSSAAEVKARFREVDRILSASQSEVLRPALWTDRIDRVVLHPLWGSLLLIFVLALVFQAIFNLAAYPMDWIEGAISVLGNWMRAWISNPTLQSLIIDGAMAGVGAVVVFLPQILLLFFFILMLEDSGYMARAAFLMDKPMSRVGLHGRAFIPLLSSFACAIPGIMATRTIENRRDRLITILISPLMACSARVPVYTLLISAFIPNKTVWGPIKLQGLVMLGLYIVGAWVGLLIAWLLHRMMFRGRRPALLLEMPTYKWPNFRNIVLGMWERAKLFLRRAGTVILGASIVIWALASYPKAPENRPAGESAITYSIAGKLGKLIEPAIKPIGFDWSIGVGLITGMVAREVIVGSLATVYSIESPDEEVTQSNLSHIIKQRWSLATGLSLLVYFVFAMQCLSTLAVVRRETNSWRWPVFMFVYMTALAYGASWITFHLTQVFI